MKYALLVDDSKSLEDAFGLSYCVSFISDTGEEIRTDSLDYAIARNINEGLRLIEEKGVPAILAVDFDLDDGTTGLMFINKLFELHKEGKLDLIKVKKFYPASFSYGLNEKLYNAWWKFHEEYLNKRELETKKEKKNE